MQPFELINHVRDAALVFRIKLLRFDQLLKNFLCLFEILYPFPVQIDDF